MTFKPYIKYAVYNTKLLMYIANILFAEIIRYDIQKHYDALSPVLKAAIGVYSAAYLLLAILELVITYHNVQMQDNFVTHSEELIDDESIPFE